MSMQAVKLQKKESRESASADALKGEVVGNTGDSEFGALWGIPLFLQKSVTSSGPPMSLQPKKQDYVSPQIQQDEEEKAEFLQAKLAVGQPGDKYEQEADHVAEMVMRMPDTAVQRKPT